MLAYRLGLPSTWARFSLRNGTSITAEPDLSGHPEEAPAAAPPEPTSTNISSQGGSSAPAKPPSGTGGASAG